MICNKKPLIFIVLLACCSMAMANGAANLTSTDYNWLDLGLAEGLLDVDLTTDLSAALLSSIFGDFSGMLPTVTQGAGGLISLLFGYFNKGLFIIAGMLVTYSAVLSTIKTAEDGKTMGERTPIAWSIFRPVLGTSILVPVYNGYSVLQTFLMWSTLAGIGLANSIWSTAINTFNIYGNLGGVTSSISGDNSTSYSSAESLVQDLFNSQFCFYSARKEYAKNKVAADQLIYIKNTTEETYSGVTTCSTSDSEAPCYNFYFDDSSVPASQQYTLSYSNLPEGYDCGNYKFSNTNGIYTAGSSLDTSGSFWSDAETLLSGLVYTVFVSVDNIALDQFNSYYASGSSKDYFTGPSGQCQSSTSCLLADLLAPIAISFQDSLTSSLAIDPFTQTTDSKNHVDNNGGWILAATNYYQLVAKGNNNTYTLGVSSALTFQPTSINNITIPKDVAKPDGASDFTSSSYANVNSNLATALTSVVTDAVPASASILSGLTLGYVPDTDKFKVNMGRVQYSGVGTDLYKVIAAEIGYAAANMFTDTSVNSSYKKKMKTIATATKGGLDTTTPTTTATSHHESGGWSSWMTFGHTIGAKKNSDTHVTTSVNLQDSGAKSIDLKHMPNQGSLYNSVGGLSSTMFGYAPFARNTNYEKVIDLQINWFIAKILATWQKYFLTANLQDPVTAARNFGFEVVEQSATFLIYMAIEAFKVNIGLLVQYLGYYLMFTVLAGIQHLAGNIILTVAKFVKEVLSAIWFLYPLARPAFMAISTIAIPFKTMSEPLFAGAAAMQVLWLQMTMAYTYLWLPILFGATVPLMVLGLVLSVYAPMIPFLIFLLASINWIIGIIEAMVAAPVVALGIAHPVGHDVLGRAELCLMLIFAVMVRPAAMIFGFIFAVMLCYVTFPLFNYIFLYFMQTFFAHTILSIGGKGAAISIFFALMLYCYVILNFITQAFSMIYIIPNKVMRWIGVPVDRADEEQWLEEVKGGVEDAAGKLSKGATETPGQTTSPSDALGGMQAGREEISGAGALSQK